MTDRHLTVHDMSFSYDNATNSLFESVSCIIHRGWTGIAGPNGCGKSTFLKLLTGILTPESGTITVPVPAYYCEQRTDTMPGDFPTLLESREKNAWRIMNTLGIESDWAERWDSLSHGERKRVQIAAALFQEPALLAIDEPTNHLDIEALERLLAALKSFRGIGVLVSHDRELLDTLCRRTIFIDPPGIDVRKGCYSIAASERVHEHELIRSRDESLKKSIKRMEGEIARRQRAADSADTKKSKRTLSRKDHDGRAKLDLVRISGKDGVAGKLAGHMKARAARLASERGKLDIRKVSPRGIAFDDSSLAGIYPLIVPASTISLGGTKELAFTDIIINNSARIGLVGANGSGKSTFTDYLVNATSVPPERIVYIPQEISSQQSANLLDEVVKLSADRLGLLMAFVSRLGSDPNRLLETATPTPGETRKLMLAEGVSRNPGLIIMDEPTNHMDLPSIESLEEALDSCTCPIILVSHDRRLLDRMVDEKLFFKRLDENSYRIEAGPDKQG